MSLYTLMNILLSYAMLSFLLLAYVAFILVLYKMFKRIHAPVPLLLSILVFSIITGLLIAWAWPNEGIYAYNILVSLLGDELYSSICNYYRDAIGNCIPPVILDLPWIYVLTSIILGIIIGGVAQLVLRIVEK